MPISGRLQARIKQAFLDHFDYGELDILLRTHLDKDLENIAPPNSTKEKAVYEIIQWAEREGKLAALLSAAVEERPHIPVFAELAAALSGDSAGDNRFIIPFPYNHEFFGREEELKKLHAALQATNEQIVGIRPVLGLTGMGGIGKTQLAVMYCYQYRDDYPGGIYWLNAAEGLPEAFAKLGRLLNPSLIGGAREPQIEAVAHYVKQNPDSLLVLDNVDDPAELQIPLTSTIVAEQLPGRLLFTTRRRDIERYRPVELTTLSPDTAMRLLLRHPRRQDARQPEHPDHPAAQRICAMLGYLPQALKVAGAHLGQWATVPVAHYEAELVKRGAFPVLEDERGLRGRPGAEAREAAISATFKNMFDTLADEPEAQKLLRVAGQLPEAAQIPTARIGLLCGLPEKGKDFFVVTLSEALRRLEDSSLVDALEDDQIHLHPLVREFVRSQMSSEETTTLRHECAYNLADAFEDFYRLETQYYRRGIDALQEDLSVGLEMAASPVQPGMQQLDSNTLIYGRLEVLLRLLQKEAHNLRRRIQKSEKDRFVNQIGYRLYDLKSISVGNANEWLIKRQIWVPHWIVKRESAGLIRTLAGHSAVVRAVAVTVDGQNVISGSEDRTLKIWNLQTGQEERTLEEHSDEVRAVTVTPNGHQAISASRDHTLKVWNLHTGEVIYTLIGHEKFVWAVVVTLDGQKVISASADRTLKMWDLQTGQLEQTFLGHRAPVLSVGVTQNGLRMISGSQDRTLRVWNLQNGQTEQILAGHDDGVSGVAVNPNGQWAVSASFDKTLKLWNLSTGFAEITLTGHSDGINAVTVTPDWKWLVSTSNDRTLKLWNLKTGQVERTLEGHGDGVGGVAVTKDGLRVVSASNDRTLKVWNLKATQVDRFLEGHTSFVLAVKITPDGQRMVSASDDQTVKVWDLRTGRIERTFEAHKAGVRAIAVNSNRNQVISASDDSTLIVWNIQTGQIVRTLMKHQLSINSLAIAIEGQQIISASEDHTLKVWNSQSGLVERTLEGHDASVLAVAINPEGQQIVSASEDRTIRLWNLTTGELERTLVGHENYVWEVAVSHDGQKIISASEDGTLKVWSLTTGQITHTLVGHGLGVRAVDVTQDGKWVISASNDRTLKVWNLHTGELLTSISLEHDMLSVAVAPDGRTVVAGDAGGNVYCFELNL